MAEPFHLLHFSTLTSTSDWAREQLDQLADHTVVVADVQTGGRGRKGRGWHSELGGLYFTWVFRSPLPIGQQPHYAQVAALAIAHWLEKEGVVPELKWPNDLLVNGAKISGILLDAVGDGEARRLLLGIGLNVSNRPQVVDYPTTSLKEVTGKSYSTAAVLKELLEQLRTSFQLLEEAGMRPFAKQLSRFNHLVGKEQKLLVGEKLICGVVEGINEEGALLFRSSDGELRVVWSGELIL